MSLKHRPQIKPGSYVVNVHDDCVRIANGRCVIDIEGEAESILELLVLLDGRRGFDDVVGEVASNHGIDPPEVMNVIEELHQSDFIVDADIDLDWQGDYSRQHSYFSLWASELSDIPTAQKRIEQTRVLFIGVGGIGCLMLDLMTRAGVKHVRLVDHDLVERSNLNRQLLFSMSDIGHMKVEVAAARVRAVTEDTDVDVVPREIASADDIRSMASGIDFAVVSADTPAGIVVNWANDALVPLDVPFILAGYVGSVALAGPLVIPHETPCFACDQEQSSGRTQKGLSSRSLALLDRFDQRSVAPSMGPFCACAASLAARDALMFLTGLQRPRTAGSAALLDTRSGELQYQALRVTHDCRICGAKASVGGGVAST